MLRAELLEALAEEDDDAHGASPRGARAGARGAARGAAARATLAGTLVPVLCGVGAAQRRASSRCSTRSSTTCRRRPTCRPCAGVDPRSGARRAAPERSGGAARGAGLQAAGRQPRRPDLPAPVRGHARGGGPGLQPAHAARRSASRGSCACTPTRATSIERAGPGRHRGRHRAQARPARATRSARARHPILLESLSFPEPVITLVVEPVSSADRDKLRAALDAPGARRPELPRARGRGHRPVVRVGDGGAAPRGRAAPARVRVPRARSTSGSRASPTAKPRARSARGAARVERTLGGQGGLRRRRARGRAASGRRRVPAVAVEFAPAAAVPQAFRAAVAEALAPRRRMVGPRFGYPLVDARVRVTGGESNPRIDAELGFVQAAVQALRQATSDGRRRPARAGHALRDPGPRGVHRAGSSPTSTRAARRSRAWASRSACRPIAGTVPLVHMFGYATAVRSLSQGRASFTMRPAGFRTVPEEELARRGLVWT